MGHQNPNRLKNDNSKTLGRSASSVGDTLQPRESQYFQNFKNGYLAQRIRIISYVETSRVLITLVLWLFLARIKADCCSHEACQRDWMTQQRRSQHKKHPGCLPPTPPAPPPRVTFQFTCEMYNLHLSACVLYTCCASKLLMQSCVVENSFWGLWHRFFQSFRGPATIQS